MKYIIVDLESTCWERDTRIKDQEIIEIGAVKLNESLEPVDEYDRFVRPVEIPKLSSFCQNLTSIKQEDVDRADTFEVVFPHFVAWIEESPYNLASWGEYDIKQIQVDCRRYALKFPRPFAKKHINVKTLFAKMRRIRPCGMKQALLMMHLPLEGTHHRAIDDARNISTIFREVYK